MPFFQWHLPMQTSSREICNHPFFTSLRHSIDKQFHFRTIGIYQHFFLFSGFSPTYRPGMPINMNHRFFSPIRLKNKITFFQRTIAFHNPFLIDIRYWIIGT